MNIVLKGSKKDINIVLDLLEMKYYGWKLIDVIEDIEMKQKDLNSKEGYK